MLVGGEGKRRLKFSRETIYSGGNSLFRISPASTTFTEDACIMFELFPFKGQWLRE